MCSDLVGGLRQLGCKLSDSKNKLLATSKDIGIALSNMLEKINFKAFDILIDVYHAMLVL